jgi:hypothetical protein
MAFHEKAGRSQADSVVSTWNMVFSLPPSRHGRHPSIRALEERIVSLGACWAFSVQPVLPAVRRPFRHQKMKTQSPELGVRFLIFLFLERF